MNLIFDRTNSQLHELKVCKKMNSWFFEWKTHSFLNTAQCTHTFDTFDTYWFRFTDSDPHRIRNEYLWLNYHSKLRSLNVVARAFVHKLILCHRFDWMNEDTDTFKWEWYDDYGRCQLPESSRYSVLLLLNWLNERKSSFKY